MTKEQEKLVDKTNELQTCQAIKGKRSCWPCDKKFDCQLRTDYVTFVHKSMNKDLSAGFEF